MTEITIEHLTKKHDILNFVYIKQFLCKFVKNLVKFVHLTGCGRRIYYGRDQKDNSHC